MTPLLTSGASLLITSNDLESFLSKIAKCRFQLIPESNQTPRYLNHLVLGIICPSNIRGGALGNKKGRLL